MQGSPASQGDLDALRIVLLDESTDDGELLTVSLGVELPTATIWVAASLEDGMTALASGADVVITALSLPDVAGLGAVHALRAAVPDKPIIVLTSLRDSDLGMAAMLAGADDYLVKGELTGRALATAVQYAVQRRNLERTNHRYERLALSLLDAMESPTCAVSQRGDIIAVNAAWSSFTALGAATTDVGRSYAALCEAAPALDVTSAVVVCDGLRSVLDGTTPRFQHDFPSSAGTDTTWFSVRISPLPDAGGAVLTHVDVTVAKRAEQALAHQTLHDPLTDLPNRDLLASRLSWAMSSSARHGLFVGVAFLDLDQFKRINDSLGHHAGDELLVAVTKRLRSRLRSEDTLARFAGDEFVVVWPDLASAADAETLAERLRTAFEDPFQLQQATVSLSASIGVALGVAPQLPDELLLAADAAMYDAKSRGRGRTRLFSAELREGAASRLRLEAEMQGALERGQFVLHYQPVVDLRAGKVPGVEALIRWEHPAGLRMPDSFIPVAEASGFIVPLGGWVLQEACRQVAEWERQGLVLDVAVNLSVRQVAHPEIVATIADALASSGLDAHRLMLEVTETAVLEDAEAAQVALSRIAELGVKIAIDDFGTGYSSLLYLKRYPVGALKVDRSFVAGMSANNDDHAIVTSVVSLARAVGSACIAEGVETAEQHAALLAMGCDFAQGFLFGRPVGAADIAEAVRACEITLDGGQDAAPARLVPVYPGLEEFVLDRIEQMHSAGASLHTIAAALNREHAPHPEALRWHSVMVAQIVAGEYRPSRRRRSSAAGRSSAPVLVRQHRSLFYRDEDGLAAELVGSLSAALDNSEGVVVVASADERAALREALAPRHDLDALSFTSQYRTWDAGEVVRELTVDGYISGRLFRQVVGRRVETALARFGRVHVYTGMAALLWEKGEITSAFAVEDQWQKLADRLAFDLICGYSCAGLDQAGSDADRLCLHDRHRVAA